ncbi:hypothetical protein B0T26DRAFT_414544 [Lasiosphaeria miniovina]|uniref:Adenosine deaminase domain-containing protein n=1 Tax=Lasiosphaeria miniovina TaxID=1954250 RepID=A0AA40A5C3_9PEZI|nr:uncharacterized protein B0T26DRAFT_414544 [Lasiosphaeria miniovina]KAK0709628.1 hypothetical protein B0T26DRAFT_414544 [Lasiosphaeria miniovina]
MKRFFCFWPFTDGNPSTGAPAGDDNEHRHYHHVSALRNFASTRSAALKKLEQAPKQPKDFVKIMDEIYNLKNLIHAEYDTYDKADRGAKDEEVVKKELEAAIAPHEANIKILMDDYNRHRDTEILREQALGSEQTSKEEYLDDTIPANKSANKSARQADEILTKARDKDLQIFANERKYVDDNTGMEYPHYNGDHFVSNRKTIEKTRLFAMAEMFPKGSHLHIHFNSNLSPDFLLSRATQQTQMYIGSNKPLGKNHSGYKAHNWKQCAIYFHIRDEDTNDCQTDIFSDHYAPGPTLFPKPFAPESKYWMPLWKFRHHFKAKYSEAHPKLAAELEKRADAAYREKRNEYNKNYDIMPPQPSSSDLAGLFADQWLQEKLAVQEYDANHPHQNPKSAWEDFNIRTGFMKGLTNYESGYKEYCEAFMWQCVRDCIQYVEIRPNFMTTNQIQKDDASETLSNLRTVELIIEAYNKLQVAHKYDVVQGLRIIYCTPRVMDAVKIEELMDECILWLQNPFISQFIAGFDLIGEEGNDKPHPLVHHVATLYWFKKKCAEKGVRCPLLLHCGETITIGEPSDLNLFDALILGAKRIGHGFALAYHPWVMNRMQQDRVGIELCPISNELLGLTPTIMGHAGYVLMANGLDCSVSTDNGTLFRSRLVHDFYQSMAGKRDMTLFGWVQLASDSMAHSILWGIKHYDSQHEKKQGEAHSAEHDEEFKRLNAGWKRLFKEYCDWVHIYQYSFQQQTPRLPLPPTHPGPQTHTPPQPHMEPAKVERSPNDFHDLLPERDANGSIIYQLVELDEHGMPTINNGTDLDPTVHEVKGPVIKLWKGVVPTDKAPGPRPDEPGNKSVTYRFKNEGGHVKFFALAIGIHNMVEKKNEFDKTHPALAKKNLHWRWFVKRRPMTKKELEDDDATIQKAVKDAADAKEKEAKEAAEAAKDSPKAAKAAKAAKDAIIKAAFDKVERAKKLNAELANIDTNWKKKAHDGKVADNIWKWGIVPSAPPV